MRGHDVEPQGERTLYPVDAGLRDKVEVDCVPACVRLNISYIHIYTYTYVHIHSGWEYMTSDSDQGTGQGVNTRDLTSATDHVQNSHAHRPGAQREQTYHAQEGVRHC